MIPRNLDSGTTLICLIVPHVDFFSKTLLMLRNEEATVSFYEQLVENETTVGGMLKKI